MPLPASRPVLPDALLRGVSRSFYLSIRLLPRGLREPVGLAYLLARATDTVADAASVPAGERQDLLAHLGRAIASGAADGPLFEGAARLAQLQAHDDERQLLRRLPECFDGLAALQERDRADVRTVLGHIVRGQSLDLQRFPDPSSPRALPDAAALLDYAYLVAGSVGEFWTEVCLRHLAGYAQRDAQEMRALGRSFGIGLQLVNIVRDVGDDLAAGRCYLPADELAQAGLEPGGITAQAERFLPVWQRWQDIAARGLDDGMAYAQAVRSRRVRAAVALPALLGRQTLLVLRAAGPAALTTRVKVPRSQVRWLLARMAIGLAGRGMLQREWDNRAR